MAVIILPDAQADFLSLQDEIFEKLEKVDSGIFNGTPVQELASVGILDYQNVYSSHHKLVYRRIGSDTYVYLIAGHRQDYPTILAKRLLRR